MPVNVFMVRLARAAQPRIDRARCDQSWHILRYARRARRRVEPDFIPPRHQPVPASEEALRLRHRIAQPAARQANQMLRMLEARLHVRAANALLPVETLDHVE